MLGYLDFLKTTDDTLLQARGHFISNLTWFLFEYQRHIKQALPDQEVLTLFDLLFGRRCVFDQLYLAESHRYNAAIVCLDYLTEWAKLTEDSEKEFSKLVESILTLASESPDGKERFGVLIDSYNVRTLAVLKGLFQHVLAESPPACHPPLREYLPYADRPMDLIVQNRAHSGSVIDFVVWMSSSCGNVEEAAKSNHPAQHIFDEIKAQFKREGCLQTLQKVC